MPERRKDPVTRAPSRDPRRVWWSRSHLPGIPTCRDVTSRPTAAGQCRTRTGFPHTGACGCRHEDDGQTLPPGRRAGAGARDRASTPDRASAQNGGGSWSWCRRVLPARQWGQSLVTSTRAAAVEGTSSTRWRRPRSSGQSWRPPARRRLGSGVGARRCSRRNSRSLCGRSGAWVRVELGSVAVADRVASPVRAVVPSASPVRRVVLRASAGWVVRVRPVGSVQVAMPSVASTRASRVVV